MVIQEIPTLEPSQTASPEIAPLASDREILFASIAQEGSFEKDSSPTTALTKFFTGLLWTGYVAAIVVALVLVWSAAKELLN